MVKFSFVYKSGTVYTAFFLIARLFVIRICDILIKPSGNRVQIPNEPVAVRHIQKRISDPIAATALGDTAIGKPRRLR